LYPIDLIDTGVISTTRKVNWRQSVALYGLYRDCGGPRW
jgi:hypothetical protein